MPRAKRGNKRTEKRKKILARAKGFRGTKSKLYRSAKESVEKALKYAYTGRKLQKRDFRRLWIVRINAACRLNEMKYSQFMNGLKLAGVELDRKVLADLAVKQPETFATLVGQAKDAINSNQKQATAQCMKRLALTNLLLFLAFESVSACGSFIDSQGNRHDPPPPPSDDYLGFFFYGSFALMIPIIIFHVLGKRQRPLVVISAGLLLLLFLCAYFAAAFMSIQACGAFALFPSYVVRIGFAIMTVILVLQIVSWVSPVKDDL